MIRSMTGYGKSTANITGRQLTVEITSVNSRYLEISVRLPRILAEYEANVREKVAESVSRGKLSVGISFEGNSVAPESLRLNEEVAALYYKMFCDLKQRFKLQGELSISHFTGLPDLFTVSNSHQLKPGEVKELMRGVERATAALNRMREREGKALGDDMVRRIRLIEKAVTRIGKYKAKSLEHYRKRLNDVLENLQQQGALIGNDETRLRLNMELALLVDKSDVTEECVRLRSHLGAFVEAIDSAGDAGKRLNFILQEMNREANTIGSKAGIYEISAEVITIREEIEKLREQVQNIE